MRRGDILLRIHCGDLRGGDVEVRVGSGPRRRYRGKILYGIAGWWSRRGQVMVEAVPIPGQDMDALAFSPNPWSRRCLPLCGGTSHGFPSAA